MENTTMSTTTRLQYFSAVLALSIGSLFLLQGRASAALTNNVPVNWNTIPITQGAYRDLIPTNTTPPDWALIDAANVLSNVTTGTIGSFPVRSNVWFTPGSSTNVLIFAGNVAITNSLSNTISQTGVSFATNALFVDMKIQFSPLDDSSGTSPDTNLLAQSKLALYANANSNLVVAVYNASGNTYTYTTNTPLDLTKWYQLTVKMQTNSFTVLTNDIVAFKGKINIATGAGVSNALSAFSISGPGGLSELYVSYGDPAYKGGWVPYTATNFPGTGGAAVTNYLAQYFQNGTLSSTASFVNVNSTQLDAAYLLGLPLDTTVNGTSNSPAPPVYSFGIKAIQTLSATNVQVTAQLTTNGTTAAKSGAINGKIRVRSKATSSNDWDTATVTTSPTQPVSGQLTFDSNGQAMLIFAVPATDQFFKAQIVDPATN